MMLTRPLCTPRPDTGRCSWSSVTRPAAVILLCGTLLPLIGHAGPYPPAAGEPGSTAIPLDDPRIVGWASQVVELVRGPQDMNAPAGPLAEFGEPARALGPATLDPADVVSLGDGGQITLGFDQPIPSGPGWDFAVFENGFAAGFLELALVEVSADGVEFFRFPAASLTRTETQIGAFDALDPTDLHHLAGKYRQGFGTPFDLEELWPVYPGLDISQLHFVRLVDVVGSVQPLAGNPGWHPTLDAEGRIINDPYPTPFASSGFDLDAVALLRQVPEPLGVWGALGGCLAVWAGRRRRG